MIDERLQKISRALVKFLEGDLTVRESFNEAGDDIDRIIALLNELGSKLQRSGQLVANYESRVSAIMNLLLKYTLFDFSEKAPISPAGDELDAIALALNTLGEELEDRIAREKQHTEELERLASVVETTADAVICFAPNGTVFLWNKSAERIYGYLAEEMIGARMDARFSPPSEIDSAMAMFYKVLSGKQVINEHTRMLKKNGEVIDVSITMTPVVNAAGQVTSISALSRDITEDKVAEQTLRENEERFRSLVEGVKDYSIIMLDPKGNISTWNKGAEAMKGYNAEEVIGKSFEIFSSSEDRKAGKPWKLLEEARTHGKATTEGLRIRKDGSEFWGYIVLTCLHDNQGRVIGYSKITRDLTESKKKDDEIRQSHLRLEQKNIELERMNKELASFAYVSSHDLQEPLRKIQTFASRVLETDHKNLSEQGKDYFQRLNSSANRMQQLILDILDYSRLNTAQSKKEDCDLNKVIAELCDDFKDEIEEKQAEIKTGTLCILPMVPFQLKQLFQNLMSNALKFAAKDRKLKITISAEQIRAADVTGLKPSAEKYCHLSFEDNGIGFEQHFSKQIFEVFQRLHSQEVYKGTGIGLAICKKIVENHEGSISATSEPGKGTRFDIYLPVN